MSPATPSLVEVVTIPIPNLTPTEIAKLHNLMVKATCAREDFGADHLTTLITVGQGMFWSNEFDTRVRKLAQDVTDEFERQGQGDER